jgi:cytochrome c biogenesis protein CcmG/thiol:disulfide interchange protein DsbE
MVRRACIPLVVGSLAIAGCGSTPRSLAPGPQQVKQAFANSPAPLAALHAQADKLLGGGVPAFRARMAALKGYPVIVNVWASWCGPCQSEFPTYQRVAVAYGRRVAFMGIDTKDADGAASSFMAKFPVTYPSYTDPNGSIGSALQTFAVQPQTLYFDRSGRMIYDHAGPYLTVPKLERDIRFYFHV